MMHPPNARRAPPGRGALATDQLASTEEQHLTTADEILKRALRHLARQHGLRLTITAIIAGELGFGVSQ